MILNYYRRRNGIQNLKLERLIALNLPYDYLGFGVTFIPEDIVGVLTSDPYKIGLLFNNEIIECRFTEISNASWYKIDYGDEIYEEPIILIADNNIPEGGIYIDTRDSGIYHFTKEPPLVPIESRMKIADSFTEFLTSLKLYELSNKDSAYCEEIELEVPLNKDEIKLPWED